MLPGTRFQFRASGGVACAVGFLPGTRFGPLRLVAGPLFCSGSFLASSLGCLVCSSTPLAIGGSLFGIWGLLLAVPVTATARDVFSYVYRRLREAETEARAESETRAETVPDTESETDSAQEKSQTALRDPEETS